MFKCKSWFVTLIFLAEFFNFIFVTHGAVVAMQSQIFKLKIIPFQFFSPYLYLLLTDLWVRRGQKRAEQWREGMEEKPGRTKKNSLYNLGGIA